MKLFVDASALVAVIVGEPDYAELLGRLREADQRLWSRWETIAGLRRSQDLRVDAAREQVDAIAADHDFRMISIGSAEAVLAVDAYAAYGKGTDHPARLNMGDCFAYACAKANGARLLYKGDDFSHTDLA